MRNDPGPIAPKGEAGIARHEKTDSAGAGHRQRMKGAEILAELDRLISEAPPRDLPSLIGALEGARAAAWARMTVPAMSRKSEPDGSSTLERLLTPAEAANIARVPAKWLFRHTKGLRFRRNLSRKRILFEESGLRRWLDAKKPLTVPQ